MTTRSCFILSAVLLLMFPQSLLAQNAQSPSTSKGEPSKRQVIGSVSETRIRFTGLGNLIALRLEVFGPSGEVLFDSEFKSGNVVDWLASGANGQQLGDGTYLCVVSVKDATGEIVRKQAIAAVRNQSVSLRDADSSLLSSAQSASVVAGEDVNVTIVEAGVAPTAVLAHDGAVAHLVSGRGGLSISSGDFFANKVVEHIRITAEGDVGIGVAIPQARLDVAGRIKATEGIVFPDGSVQLSAAKKTLGAASLKQSDSQDAKAQDASPDISGTGTTGKIPKWLDGPTGVLGDSNITEASSAIGINGAPSTSFRLDVNGSTRIRGSNPGFNLEGLRPAGNIWLFQTVDDDGRFRLFGQDNVNPGVERFTINLATGNVGIGATSPGAKLEIGGNALLYPPSGPGSLHIRNRTTGDFSQVVFDDNNNAYRGYIGYVGASAGLGARNDTVEFGTQFNDLTFRPSEVEAMRVTSTGRLGIGIANPTQKLHVSGTGIIRSLVNSDTNAGMALGLGGVLKWSVATVDPGTFRIFNEVTASNALIIDPSSNNLGVGTTPNFYKLSVNSPSDRGLFVNATALGGTVAEFGSSGEFWIDNATTLGGRLKVTQSSTVLINDPPIGHPPDNAQRLIVNGFIKTGVGQGGTTALCLNGSDEISVCGSSIRYKENINDFTSGLNLIRRLRPVRFDWKQGHEHDLGLVAEEVADVEPLLVTHNSKGEIEGVKYDRVGVVLLNAVKEQQRQITSQQAQIEKQQRIIEQQQRQSSQQAEQLHKQQQQFLQQQQEIEALKKLARSSHRWVRAGK